MCGIMGSIGSRSAKNVVYSGLKRQEYRGYDSAGIAVLTDKVSVSKSIGDTSKINLELLPESATVGIGHTRWATHGKPSKINAHPHTFGKITLVHNGIIENFEELKKLIDSSKLQSQTDSEVLAALIDHFYVKTNDLLEATKLSLLAVKGTFGMIMVSPDAPDQIITARRGSPVVIGIDDDQYYIASDPSAIIDYTDKVIYLEDDQVAVITSKSLDVYDLGLNHQDTNIRLLDGIDHKASKDDFDSYLEKEIFEQPSALQNTMRGRVGSDGTIRLGGPHLTNEEIQSLKHIVIIGCGSAYYAGFYAKYKLEEMLGISVSVEHGSEFRYRYGAYDAPHTLAIFMSQSGETADTLASLKEAKRRQIMTMGIVNTVGSTLAREVDHGGIYLHAGVETSVASTKAFTAMVTALLMFGGYIANKQGLNSAIMRDLARELSNLQHEISSVLKLKPQIDKIAHELVHFHDWFYLGRGEMYPVALEGALKISEVAYAHAQAFPTGEMKHGPISLIDNRHVTVLLLPEDELLYEKGLSSLQEIKARDGNVMTISTRPKPKDSDYHVQIAHNGPYTDGLIINTCLQLLALAIATMKKRNIDRPRNLAKSVTVE